MAAQHWELGGGGEHITRQKAKALGGAKLVLLLQHCYKPQESPPKAQCPHVVLPGLTSEGANASILPH